MRALVVGDHPIARRGLTVLLQEGVGVHTVLSASGPLTALALARREAPELVLLDMHMSGAPPVRELCAQLRAILPSATIVLVTAFERPAHIRDCLDAGANGCLLKDTCETELVGSLRRALSGETVVDARIPRDSV